MSSTDRLGEARPGTLHALLQRKLPAFVSPQGHLAIARLATALQMSHETMYRAVRGNKSKGYPNGRLTIEVAVRLFNLSRVVNPDDPLYLCEALPYMIPNYPLYTDPKSLLE